jgi:hypothetical protein
MAQRHVEALKYARNLIKYEYDYNEFICVALNRYYREGKYSDSAKISINQVKSYIEKVLLADGTNNVESWLTKKGYYSPSMGSKLLQEYRLR